MPDDKDKPAANQKTGKITTYSVTDQVRINESTRHREAINVRDSVRPPKGGGTRR